MTTALSIIPTVTGESVRHNDARVARGAAPIIDAEPVKGCARDHDPRAYRAAQDARSREQGLPARVVRNRAQDAETTSLGFAAQHIAQEVLSDGLYFENFRPALAAYSAVDTNFVHVRRPPPASVVIWA